MAAPPPPGAGRVKCVHCGATVSEKAVVCLTCGKYPQGLRPKAASSSSFKLSWVVWIVIGFLVLAALVLQPQSPVASVLLVLSAISMALAGPLARFRTRLRMPLGIMGTVAFSVLAVLFFFGAAFAMPKSPSSPTAQQAKSGFLPTPTVSAPAVAQAPPTQPQVAAVETATNQPATPIPPTAAPKPTSPPPTPVPPTAVPKQVPVANFTVRFGPNPVRVGQRLAFTLTVESMNDVPITDLKIRLNGSWDKVTVISTEPGVYDVGLFNIRHIVVPGAVAPGQSREIVMVVSPNEPGNLEFDFSPFYASTSQLKKPDGEQPMLNAKVSVTR